MANHNYLTLRCYYSFCFIGFQAMSSALTDPLCQYPHLNHLFNRGHHSFWAYKHFLNGYRKAHEVSSHSNYYFGIYFSINPGKHTQG